jgi:uncharacterized membrane protein
MEKAAGSMISKPYFAVKLVISILGFTGIGISGYLTYVHYRSLSSICLFNMHCDAVLTSRYATMWGIPLSLLGLLMYVFLTGLSLWSLRAKEEHQNTLAMAVYATALTGTLFTIYLYYLEIFEIHGFCTWCIGSSIVIVCILVLALIDLFSGREQIKEKSRSRRFKLSHYIRW